MTLPSESIHLYIYAIISISLLQGNKLHAAKESFAAARQGLRAAVRRSLWWNATGASISIAHEAALKLINAY
jgi:hypothetical protein